MLRYEAIVIGGGIAGVSLAHYLAVGGVRDILVVERGMLASGCTGGSMGGVRQQFGSAPHVELAKRGRSFWSTFEEVFERPCPYMQDGYLMVTSREDVLERLVRSAAVQIETGAPDVEVLAGDQIKELVSWMSTGDLRGGCWTPLDGRVNPTDGLYGLAAEARTRGVTFRERFPVTGIVAESGGWLVEGAEPVWAPTVVIAAGLGSPDLARPFGVDLPIRPYYVHYAMTSEVLTGERLPVTVDLDTGWCVEREQDGAIVTVLDSEATPAYTASDMMVEFGELSQVRAPVFTQLTVRRTISAAADTVDGDGNPYIGELERGLWTMTGLDGHGTMMGPAIGQMTADLILGIPDPVIDTSIFAPRRSPAAQGEWMRATKQPRGAVDDLSARSGPSMFHMR